MKIDASIPAAAQGVPTSAELGVSMPKDQKLDKACDQFEGMMVRQILQDGLKPLLAKPLGDNAAGSGVYDYMVTDTMANGISGKNGMGISHLLQAQLGPHKTASNRRPTYEPDHL